jgi:nuclear pore complex protein Nup210
MNVDTCCFQVSVRLPHAEYQHVPAIEVQLMVVANLIIDPADIYLLKGDSVQYRILQVSCLSVFMFYKLK